MKNTFINILFSITIVIFGVSFSNFYALSTNEFNTNNILNSISFLSSDDLKGRLPGTIENKTAGRYIKEEFEKANLLPYTDNYIDTFSVLYPERLDGEPYLNVVGENDTVIKTFKYGIDYVEDGINFKVNTFQFSQGTHTLNTSENGPNKISFGDKNILVKTNDKMCLFFTTDKGSLDFRSSFFESHNISIAICVTSETLDELKESINNNYRIECHIPYAVKSGEIENIIGYIKGKNSKLPPLILTAHFDHVGENSGGTIYNGALDNASGISFLMELSKYIKSLKVPERDIIFVGLNAEEFGFLGSNDFVSRYKDKIIGGESINFDMIGRDAGIPISIMGSKNDSPDNELIKELSAIATRENLHFNYLFQDASDHVPFRNNNISAVTLCDDDTEKIHTSKDDPNYISKSAILRCFNLVSKEIIRYAYLNDVFLLFPKEIMFCSLLLSVILYFISSYNKNTYN